MGIVMFLIVIFVIGGAVTLILIGLRQSKGEDPLQARLAEYAMRGETASLEDIELSQPLSERVIFPLARKFGQFAVRFTPQNALQNTARRLELAGNPRGMDPTVFWAARFIVAIVLGGLMIFLMTIGVPTWSWSRKLLIVSFFVLFGFFLPELLLTSRIQRRQKSIRRAMPDALDLLTICVEAGLGFDGAMSKVYEKWDNELALALGRVLREIQLGKLRRDAFRDIAERIGVA